MTIAPIPVQVQLSPVATLLFFLKYVFKAKALDDIVIPIPTPEIGNINIKYFLNSNNFANFDIFLYVLLITYRYMHLDSCNLPYKIEKQINTPVKVFMVDNITIDVAQIRAPVKPTCLKLNLRNNGPLANPVTYKNFINVYLIQSFPGLSYNSRYRTM